MHPSYHFHHYPPSAVHPSSSSVGSSGSQSSPRHSYERYQQHHLSRPSHAAHPVHHQPHPHGHHPGHYQGHPASSKYSYHAPHGHAPAHSSHSSFHGAPQSAPSPRPSHDPRAHLAVPSHASHAAQASPTPHIQPHIHHAQARDYYAYYYNRSYPHHSSSAGVHSSPPNGHHAPSSANPLAEQSSFLPSPGRGPVPHPHSRAHHVSDHHLPHSWKSNQYNYADHADAASTVVSSREEDGTVTDNPSQTQPMRPSVVSNVSNHSSPNRSSPKRSTPERNGKAVSDSKEHKPANKERHSLGEELETVIEEAVNVAAESSRLDKENQRANNVSEDYRMDSDNEASEMEVTESKDDQGVRRARSTVSALLIAAAKSDSMDLDDVVGKRSTQAKSKETKVNGEVGNGKLSDGEEHSRNMMDRRSPDEAMEGRLSPSEDGNRRESASEVTSAKVSLRRSPPPPSLSGMMNASSAGPLKKRRKMEGSLFDSTEASLGASASFGGMPQREEESEGEKMSRTNENAAVKFHFPKKLHRLLSLETNNEVDNQIGKAIEWLPHGNGWRVLRWDVMCVHVLPRYFDELLQDFDGRDGDKARKDDRVTDSDADKTESKFSDEQWIDAFLSQVNAWGFEKVRSGIDMGCYRNKFFAKEAPELCLKMECGRSSSFQTFGEDIGSSNSSLEGGMAMTSKVVASTIFKPRAARDEPHDDNDAQHPSYLHVPMLTATGTSSFSEVWGSNNPPNASHKQHPSSREVLRSKSSDMHFPHPYPPTNSKSRTPTEEVTRSPKIRFSKDIETASSSLHPGIGRENNNQGSQHPVTPVDISPNTESVFIERANSFPKHQFKHASFPVSRRGGRGGGLRPVAPSRHASR
mmetsp:Transcript_4963/g.10413  ORF Transcript_4963/g.10413 Transcript_4963/m.10413 type:complete len:864 (-) Transcript_4963:189-2780(-)